MMSSLNSLDKYREMSWALNKPAIQEDPNRLPRLVNGECGDVPWDLSPDYQRDHVWTKRQKELFVGHYIEGGIVPPIYVQRYESGAYHPSGGRDGWLSQPCEVIDGKQRVQALLDWIAGDIEAEVTEGDRIRYADLNATTKRMLPRLKVTYIDMSRTNRLRFYLRLNRGGTVHSDAEIQKVRDLLASESE